MKRIGFSFALLLPLIVASVIPATASTIYYIPPEAPSYLINPSAGGVDVLEALIQTPGLTFASSGFANLDSGWSDVNVNPTYSLEYGTRSTWLTEDLNIVGSMQSFTVDFFGYTGCASLQPTSVCPAKDLTDAYAVHFVGGSYDGWTALTADNLSVGESITPTVPEPTTVLLIASGLIGLGVSRFRKRRTGFRTAVITPKANRPQ